MLIIEGSATPPSSQMNCDSSSLRFAGKSGGSYIVAGGFPRLVTPQPLRVFACLGLFLLRGDCVRTVR